MSKIEVACNGCTQFFMAEKREVNRGMGKYCSRECSSTYNKRPPVVHENNVVCAWCGVYFFMLQSKMKNSRSGLRFCSKEHKDAAQKLGGIKEIMPAHYGMGNGQYSYRADALKHYGAVCNQCGYKNNIAGIVVHHKDENRKNNDMSNLEVLCATCHFTTHYGK